MLVATVAVGTLGSAVLGAPFLGGVVSFAWEEAESGERFRDGMGRSHKIVGKFEIQ